MDNIPVIDLAQILKSDGNPATEEAWTSVSKQTAAVLSGIGFVYFKNHGVAEEMIERAFEESRRFFELSHETKQKYLLDPKKSNSGYIAPNQEQLDFTSVYEYREGYDLPINLPRNSCPIIRPDEDVPNFSSVMHQLERACVPLINALHRILARGLDLEDEYFFVKRATFLEDPNVETHATFRSIYYPPIPDTLEIGPGTIRCAPHTDYGTLTLLFQDHVGGLEVKNAMNEWVAARPIPGTVLVNTGDLLSFWSGGMYPATLHRVLIPESESLKRSIRQSITYFVHPDANVLVVPLNKDEDETSDGQKIKPVTAYEHGKMRVEMSYKKTS